MAMYLFSSWIILLPRFCPPPGDPMPMRRASNEKFCADAACAKTSTAATAITAVFLNTNGLLFLLFPQTLRSHTHDPLAVEASVLDEDGSRVPSGDRAPCDEKVRHVRFERFRVQVGRERLVVDRDSRGAHQRRVRMIPGQQEDMIRRNLLASLVNDDGGRRDLDHARVEMRLDRAFLDAILH